jgi:hypothetical protein
MHYTVCDFVLDIFQNAIEAGSSRVRLSWEEDNESLSVVLEDNGCGMTEAELERARDPFYSDGRKHSRRKVGLGIPFLEQAVKQCGGDLAIVSEKGKGTTVSIRFPLTHMDSPPPGDRVALFLQALCFDGGYELNIERIFPDGNRYDLVRSELRDAVGDFQVAGNMALLRTFLESQEGL